MKKPAAAPSSPSPSPRRRLLLLLLFIAAAAAASATSAAAPAVFGDPSRWSSWLSLINQTSSPSSLQPSPRRLTLVDLSSPFPSAASSPPQIVVAKDGSAQFRTVQAAVDSIPKSNSARVVILIKPGTYKEKVVVDADWITFQGSGASTTEIQWNDTATSAGNTFKSASVAVNGDHFTAKDISFRNNAPAPPGGAVGRQAVALRISGDYGAFFNVSVYGAQDTLYDHKGRHYFYKCYIEGSIDYMFGNGRSLYLECHLHSIADSTGGSLTAQKRGTTSDATGFSFVNCAVTGSGYIYLGRAWGAAARVVYSYTNFANIIRPEGWFDWGVPDRRKTVYFAEYKCSGPGSNRTGRVSWSRELTDSEAQPFLTTGFINGETWLSEV